MAVDPGGAGGAAGLKALRAVALMGPHGERDAQYEVQTVATFMWQDMST